MGPWRVNSVYKVLHGRLTGFQAGFIHVLLNLVPVLLILVPGLLNLVPVLLILGPVLTSECTSLMPHVYTRSGP